MKRRFCARLMYLGLGYSGFQKQNNAPSIQEKIELALSTILSEKITIVGCGRTDAGVNAKNYYCHFDSYSDNPSCLLFNINGILGEDIVIEDIFIVKNDFHARFDAIERSYEYHVHTRKNPFLKDSSFHLRLGKSEIDFDLLHKATALLLDYTDFNTFCKTKTDVKTTLCKLIRSEWEIINDRMIYHITADRFLRGMVRLIVGAILNVSRGNLSLTELKVGLERKERLHLDWSVPAHGLYLNNILYPEF